MKYRAKCTYCIPQMMNIYKPDSRYFCHDDKDHYLEVNTEHEADLIEEINSHMENATLRLKALTDYLSTV